MNSYKLNMRRGTEQDYRASDNIWNTSGLTADSMRPRRTVTAVDGSTKLAITPNDFQKTLSLSRQLFARVTEVSGALLQKNNYVIGDSWEPRFDGADQEWGREAEDYLERWFKVCNLRGEPFDWTTSLYVDSLAIDRDGDAAMILAVVDGEPRLQFVAAHQIGSRSIAGNSLERKFTTAQFSGRIKTSSATISSAKLQPMISKSALKVVNSSTNLSGRIKGAAFLGLLLQ